MQQGKNLLESAVLNLDCPNPIILLHSNITSLASAESTGFPYKVIDTINSLSNNGVTFILPAYTFSFCQSGTFDINDTRSETGILADLVHQKLLGSIRTKEPIYSHVLVGPKKEELAHTESETTFGEGSIFEKIEELNGYVAFVNVGWEYATIFHRYEELKRVPYRYYKKFTGIMKGYNGIEQTVSSKMFVRDLYINAENNMNLALPLIRQSNSYRCFQDELLKIELAQVADISKIACKMLDADIWSLVSNKIAAKHRLSQAEAKAASPAYKIAIMGPGNIDMFPERLEQHLTATIPARNFEIWSCPYGQLFESILDESSEFNSRPFDLVISPACSIDFRLDEGIEIFEDKFTRYFEAIKTASRKKGCKAILHRLDMPASVRMVTLEKDIRKKIDTYNMALESIAQQNHNFIIIDQAALLNQSSGSIIDHRLHYISKIGYSHESSKMLIKHWSSYIIDLLGFSIRAIVVDLDNTIWGGVVGEDGVEGLKIGGDFPGNCFYEFQSLLCKLAKNGIMLAINSKNNPSDVTEVFNKLNMPLDLKMFAVKKINWEEKYTNIISIANELNLGLDSILFIDDNPAEREKIKHFLPEVHVLELADQPESYVQCVEECIYLSSAVANKNGIDRTTSIRIRQEINRLESNSTENSLQDYLKKLDTKISFHSLNASNLQRAEQLCQKTNQFNTTTKRYFANELSMMSDKKDSAVIIIGHQSRDQLYEDMGLITLQVLESGKSVQVDSYLLSCRILGRGIEATCITWLAHNLYQEHMMAKLIGRVKRTPRNAPAQSIYNDLGFYLEENGDWCLDLNRDRLANLTYPSHIQIQNKLEKPLL